VVADDPERWAVEVGELLVARGQRVAVAESSAGGLISAALLAVPGASRFYRGGVVFYNRGGLRALLGDAGDDELPTRGASEEMVRFLAPAARAKLAADWAIGESGAAGPDKNPYGDPPGHAWISVAGPDGLLLARNVRTGESDRAANMRTFAAQALHHLTTALRP
jgi:nicotinamide-nucleotide amidase